MNKVFPAVLAITFGIAFGTATADDSSAKSVVVSDSPKKDAAPQEHVLKYKFAANEVVRWKVTHIATTETTVQANTQTSKSSSVSTKVWTVKEVDDNGDFAFEYMVENVDMWQSVDGRQEVRYNSESGEVPPVEYEAVAKTVGAPLATVVIGPSGKVVKRTGDKNSAFFGVGDITIPLPEGKVKIGSTWNVPTELMLPADEGKVQRIKVRHLYRLEKVQTGVATISMKTEVLTPVQDPKIQSQLMQRMTSGTIKFDVDAGRMMSKEVNWDENIVGFNGPASAMKYLARYTEELLPATPATARKPK